MSGRAGARAGGVWLIVHTPKWVLLGLFWLLQGAVLWVVQAFMYQWISSVDSSSGHFWGDLPPPAEVWGLVRDGEFARWMGGTLLVLTVGQAVFLWPVRRPGMSGTYGRSVRLSVLVAGAVIGFLLFAGVITFIEVLRTLKPFGPFDTKSMGVFDNPLMLLAVCLLLSWAVWTPLLLAFSKPGPREDLLTRLSRRLLIGTVVEIALIIPLDVMVRRKTSCYCNSGTYWGLTVCGFVGVFALGPAVFLPLLAKRRSHWYGSRCGVCGYDMSATPDAERCPECGTGWRAAG